jgi:hypothetical protein
MVDNLFFFCDNRFHTLFLFHRFILMEKIIEGDEHLGDLDGGVLASEFHHTKDFQETETIVENCGQKK